MRYHLTSVRMPKMSKSGNDRCWRGYGEWGTLLQCWWECKLVQPLWKTVRRFLKKLKIELPYDPAMALLGIYPKDTNVVLWRGTCTWMFIAAMSTTAKLWKEPICPLTDEWLKKMWCIYIYINTHMVYIYIYTHTNIHTHAMEYYGILCSHQKK